MKNLQNEANSEYQFEQTVSRSHVGGGEMPRLQNLVMHDDVWFGHVSTTWAARGGERQLRNCELDVRFAHERNALRWICVLKSRSSFRAVDRKSEWIASSGVGEIKSDFDDGKHMLHALASDGCARKVRVACLRFESNGSWRAELLQQIPVGCRTGAKATRRRRSCLWSTRNCSA